MRSRWTCAAALLGLALLCPAAAGPFELLAGSDEPQRALAPETFGWWGEGQLDRSAGLSFGWHNTVPLRFRRQGREYGQLAATSTTWKLAGDGPRVHWEGSWRRQSTRLGLERDRSANEVSWFEEDARLVAAWQVAPRWQLRAVAAREDGDRTLQSLDPSLQPSSDGQFAWPTARLACGAGWSVQVGTTTCAVGAGWWQQQSSVRASLRGLAADVGLAGSGWFASGAVTVHPPGGWTLTAGGSYRELPTRDQVTVNGIRHGRAASDTQDWRLGLAASRSLGPQVEWWGSLFSYRSSLSLSGHATVIPPPIGSFAGPRYELLGGLDLRQSGIATGVSWRAGRRTTLTAAARWSTGAVTADYRVLEGRTPATQQVVSSAGVAYDATFVMLACGVQQRLGDLRLTLYTHPAYGWLRDRRAATGPPTTGGGIKLQPDLPYGFELGLPW